MLLTESLVKVDGKRFSKQTEIHPGAQSRGECGRLVLRRQRDPKVLCNCFFKRQSDPRRCSAGEKNTAQLCMGRQSTKHHTGRGS